MDETVTGTPMGKASSLSSEGASPALFSPRSAAAVTLSKFSQTLLSHSGDAEKPSSQSMNGNDVSSDAFPHSHGSAPSVEFNDDSVFQPSTKHDQPPSQAKQNHAQEQKVSLTKDMFNRQNACFIDLITLLTFPSRN
jgi:hypothetical protein